MLNLDTHVLLHATKNQLRERESKLLLENRWSISAIVLWEIAKLAQLGRTDLDLSNPKLGRMLSNVHVWPLDRDVAIASANLDFRSDPADEVITATSIVHRIPLLTRDSKIRQSKLVEFA
ncbi:MAG: PIN domain-containing protein [Gammaproteobacteria bacterium]|nr:PIN domain-containing protein [Gammaproteobacteria bacterium]